MNINKEIFYKRFREHGKTAQDALRSANVLAKFRKMESRGLVRLRAEPEEENYFDVYGEPENEKDKKAIIHSIETYGCYWIVSERACSKCGTFEHKDSIGMCIYKNPLDPFENDYVIDLMENAIK